MTQFAKYVIETSDYKRGEQIGVGAYGAVYIYINKKTHKKYAGKVLNEFKAKEFFREIEIQSIDHPAVLKLQGFEMNNSPIILTEYMENGSLDKKIKNKSLSPTQKQIILYGIAKGIEYLNSKNVFHRDLKPGNVLLDENLYPKITDFGLSKFTEPDSDNRQSKICGTPKYHAPEVITGTYTMNADIFSLGVVIYEVITDDIQNKKVNIDNPSLPNLYRQLIIKCMDISENRPSISEIATFLYKHPLDGVDEQEFKDYALIVDNFTPEKQNEANADEYYAKALSFMESKNMIKAAKFLQHAADCGHSDARFQYSKLLLDGNGVAQDIYKGFEYLKKAADDNNNVDAQFKLAMVYLDICQGKKIYEDFEEGEGSIDYYIKESAKYMRLAADAGNSDAQYKYSMMLEQGYGVAKDDDKMRNYLKLSATNENPNIEAVIKVGQTFLEANDTQSALKYFQIASDKLDSPIGKFYYGKLLLMRKESKKSEISKKAAEYIRIAAENEDESNTTQAMAQNLFGICLHEGIGVKKSIKEAIQYFEKAASKDYPPALFNLGLEQEKKKIAEIETKMKKKSLTQANPSLSPLSSPVSFPKSQATLASKSSAPLMKSEIDHVKVFEKAFNNFKKAADSGLAEACDYYASAIYEFNFSEAEKYFIKASKLGNIDHAQYMLAEMYLDIRDKKNGKQYLTLAATQKYAPALFLLAKLNEETGKLKDALKYYQMAADQDIDQEKEHNIELLVNQDSSQERNRRDAIMAALEKFTLLLINGKPDIKNIELAMKYAEKGKELGNIICTIEYAKLTNDIPALKILADESNNKIVQYEYAKSIFCPEKIDESTYYLKLAADQHNCEACMDLGYLYERGYLFSDKDKKIPNFKRNIETSKFYFNIAADDRYPPALTKIGIDYINGVGCKKDIPKAKEYLKSAIDLGNDKNALFNYGDILMKERNKTDNKNLQDELYKEAFKYYKESAKQDSPEAQFRYASLILEILQKKELNESNCEMTESQNDDFNDDDINYETAEKNLKTAAKNHNYPLAIMKYADFLIDIRDNKKKASPFLLKAAENGNNRAKFIYGKMLYEGFTFTNRKGEEKFEQDIKNGLNYIKEAADAKFKEAEDYLESIIGKSESSSKMMPKIQQIKK